MHLAEKSPVKFSLTRNCRCFIPALLIETPDVCQNMKSIEKVAEVLKIVLSLSHGQASVGRDFSVSKSLLVENLSAKSLISQHLVYDHMNFHNLTPENFIINPALRKRVRNASSEYEKYVEEKRKVKLHSDKDLKRKAIQEEIVAVKRKKTVLEKAVVDLSKDADQYALDAENADEKGY